MMYTYLGTHKRYVFLKGHFASPRSIHGGRTNLWAYPDCYHPAIRLGFSMKSKPSINGVSLIYGNPKKKLRTVWTVRTLQLIPKFGIVWQPGFQQLIDCLVRILV